MALLCMFVSIDRPALPAMEIDIVDAIRPK
jgi:hypothetical protein